MTKPSSVISRLQDELDRERAARQLKDQEIVQLQQQIDALRVDLFDALSVASAVISVADAINSMHSTRPRYEQPQWQLERRAQMDKARAAAIATHSIVRA